MSKLRAKMASAYFAPLSDELCTGLLSGSPSGCGRVPTGGDPQAVNEANISSNANTVAVDLSVSFKTNPPNQTREINAACVPRSPFVAR